jgi:hypothetical protein
MNYTEEDILSLQNDPVFNSELETRERDALEKKDIVQLYDVLDTSLLFDDDRSDKINSLYGSILEIALQKLHTKLESEALFDLENEEDHYSLRAIYEYGIEQYSGGQLHEAKELFIMLSILTDNNIFKGAMQIHLISILKDISFDEFVERLVDMEKMNSANESFFILYFYDIANQFLHENSSLIREAIREVKNIKI